MPIPMGGGPSAPMGRGMPIPSGPAAPASAAGAGGQPLAMSQGPSDALSSANPLPPSDASVAPSSSHPLLHGTPVEEGEDDCWWLSTDVDQRLAKADPLEFVRCPVTKTTIREPILLRCLHSVSRSALPDIATGDRALSCPVCHEITTLPEAGPSALPVNRGLAALVDRMEETKKPCDNCKTPSTASVRCRQCGGAAYCKACDEKIHQMPVFRGHIRTSLLSSPDFMRCADHPDESLTLYDLKDHVPVCPYCVISGSHRGHESVPLKEAVRQARGEMLRFVRAAQKKEREIEGGQRAIATKMSAVLEAADGLRNRINLRFEELIYALQRRQSELLADIDGLQSHKGMLLQRQLDALNRSRGSSLDSWSETSKFSQFFDDVFILEIRPFVEERMKELLQRAVELEPVTSEHLKADLPHDIEAQMEVFGQIRSEEGTLGDMWEPKGITCSYTLSNREGWVWPLAVVGNTLFSGGEDTVIRAYDCLSLSEMGKLEGHTGAVCALEGDVSRLYSGSYDRTIRVWDLQVMQCSGVLEGHTAEVWALKVHGRRLYSGGGDGLIKVWSTDNLQLLGEFADHTNRVLCLEATGGLLVSGSSDFSVKLWDLSTSVCVGSLQQDGQVWCLAVCDGQIYAGTSASSVKVWDLKKLQMVTTWQGHSGSVRSLLPIGPYLLSGGCDNQIVVWDRKSGSRSAVLEGHESFVYDLVAKGLRIFSSSDDQTVKVWD